MARKYAFIINNAVVKIESIEEEVYRQVINSYQNLIDIEDEVIQPQVGWIIEGNKLVDPMNSLSLQTKLEMACKAARLFGSALCGEVTDKIGAKNLMMGKTEAQILTIASALKPIGDVLSGGAVKTARTMLIAARVTYPEYTAEFDYAINKITAFIGS